MEKSIDMKEAQSLLMKTRIPKKRNLQQRDIDDSDTDHDIGGGTTNMYQQNDGPRKRTNYGEDEVDQKQLDATKLSIAEQTKNVSELGRFQFSYSCRYSSTRTRS